MVLKLVKKNMITALFRLRVIVIAKLQVVHYVSAVSKSRLNSAEHPQHCLKLIIPNMTSMQVAKTIKKSICSHHVLFIQVMRSVKKKTWT